MTFRQAATYRPDTPIRDLAGWLGQEVEPARFPEHILRWRNDRAAATVGLAELTDRDWIRHFGQFEAVPGNLDHPLALKYHGHQFRVYNPDLGDGRGFLFAQLRDGQDRLLDLGTKGSGTTPYSRTADGRLTLKGAVREALATEMLEALGVDTSRTFSIIETGEALERGDEPSPTRSAVLTRLSHGHIRIGTFQRLLALDEADHMARLVAYCLAQFPGPSDSEVEAEPTVRFFEQVVIRLADLAASYTVAGFVHGVLNTDNMNVSGESFDYGPWRFLPRWEGGFTAAYFDHAGLYSFGRQPEALHWNCGQLAVALRLLVDAPPLIAALERFGSLYENSLHRRWCWRLGVVPLSYDENRRLFETSQKVMATGMAPDVFFHHHRGGRNADGELAAALRPFDGFGSTHDYWADAAPQGMSIERVEQIWAAIDRNDDWQAFHDAIAGIRRMGEAMGSPPPLADRAE